MERRARVSQIAKMVCQSGPDAGTEYELSKESMLIGRSAERRHYESMIVLPAASTLNCTASTMPTGCTIWKARTVFSSMAGRIASGATAWLEDGDELQFASTRFRFHDPSATITAPFLEALPETGIRVEPATRQVFINGKVLVPPLSVKQFDLLWYLYQNRGRVVSKDELANQIWAEASGDVFDASIDRMVSRVRNRIETAAAPGEPQSRLIVTVRGFGYQLADQ